MFCMVLNMGISWSASAKDVRISLIALMPTNTDIMEMEKPIANKIVVGRHLGMSSFLCKFLKKYFGEGNLPSLILKYSFELIC